MAIQRKTVRLGIIAAAVAGTVAVPATALAAQSGTLPTSIPGVAQLGREVDGWSNVAFNHGHGGVPGQPAQQHLEALARALNITVDKLKQAMEATRAELKDQKPTTPAERQALRDKTQATLAAKLGITVDALKQAEQAARPQDGGPGHKRGPEAGGRLQTLATTLGVSLDVLKPAWQQAHEATKPATPPKDAAARQAQQDAFTAALAAKLNLPVDKVKAALESARPKAPTAAEQRTHLQQMLAQMVSHQKLTQAQADQMLADFDAGKPVFEVLKQYLPQLGPGRGHGPGDDDRGRGRGPGQPQQQGSRGPQRGFGGDRA